MSPVRPFKMEIKKDAKQVKNPLQELQYTSVIHRMWGGFLRSQVHCNACGRDSNTDDPMLGITLAMQSSLKRAFRKYTEKEQLTGSEKYYCEHCKKKQNAYKRMMILKPPPVLAVHLKRFEFSQSGNRVKKSKHMQFDTTLDVGPFVCGSKAEVKYELFAVLVHSGSSAYGGHYYSYVRSPGNTSKRWYCMNDSSVSPVDTRKVLGSQAYILMYQMTPSTLKSHFNVKSKEKKAAIIKPTKVSSPQKRNAIDELTLLSRVFPEGYDKRKLKKRRSEFERLQDTLLQAHKGSKKAKADLLTPPRKVKTNGSKNEAERHVIKPRARTKCVHRRTVELPLKRKLNFECGPRKRRKVSLMRAFEIGYVLQQQWSHARPARAEPIATDPSRVSKLRRKRTPIEVAFKPNQASGRQTMFATAKDFPALTKRTVTTWSDVQSSIQFHNMGSDYIKKKKTSWDKALDTGKKPKKRKLQIPFDINFDVAQV